MLTRDGQFTCPRREGWTDDSTWVQGASTPDRWALACWWRLGSERVCSNCGSLKPERFLFLARSGFAVQGLEDGHRARVWEPTGRYLVGEVAFDHLSELQRRLFVDAVRRLEIHIDEPFQAVPFFWPESVVLPKVYAPVE